MRHGKEEETESEERFEQSKEVKDRGGIGGNEEEKWGTGAQRNREGKNENEQSKMKNRTEEKIGEEWLKNREELKDKKGRGETKEM